MNYLNSQKKNPNTGKFMKKQNLNNTVPDNNEELYTNNGTGNTPIGISDNDQEYITNIKQLLYSGWYEKEAVQKAYRLIVNNNEAIATVLVMRKTIINYN